MNTHLYNAACEERTAMHRSRRVAGVLLLFLTIPLADCSDNLAPDLPEPASSVSVSEGTESTSAVITWEAQQSHELSGFRIIWSSPTIGTDSVDVDADMRSFTIDGLTEGVPYFITIHARRGAILSAPTTVRWLPGSSLGLKRPVDLQSTPLSQSTVGLRWRHLNDSATRYVVSYKGTQYATDSGHITGIVPKHSTVEVAVSGLYTGRIYTFEVWAVRDGEVSDPVGAVNAPALRYDTDAWNLSTPIRMYEISSTAGSGLAVDPMRQGPRNLEVEQEHPHSKDVQLALYVSDSMDQTFDIGPAQSFVQLPLAGTFDNNVAISATTFQVPSLDKWYCDEALDKLTFAPNGFAFTDIPSVRSDGNSEGFVVRTGYPGNYHYARVVIKNSNGQLLQGSYPNRYVELEISYQIASNVPYSKPVMDEQQSHHARSYP